MPDDCVSVYLPIGTRPLHSTRTLKNGHQESVIAVERNGLKGSFTIVEISNRAVCVE